MTVHQHLHLLAQMPPSWRATIKRVRVPAELWVIHIQTVIFISTDTNDRMSSNRYRYLFLVSTAASCLLLYRG